MGTAARGIVPATEAPSLEPVEAPELTQRFGDPYAAYRQRVSMFVPRIAQWRRPRWEVTR